MSATTKRLRAERAAALLAERERQAKRRRTLTVAGIVLGLVLVVAAGFAVNRLRDTTNDVRADADASYAVSIGPADAPHEIVIYEDFLCPYCGELERATSDELETLGDEGNVRVTYRPFVLLGGISDYSERATAAFGVVLEESGPEVAKEFHDLLFEHQPEESGPYPDDDELVDLAVEAGADEDVVGDAIRDLDGQAFADRATAEAEDAGVDTTPTILVDGKVFTDGRTMDELADNLVAAVR